MNVAAAGYSVIAFDAMRDNGHILRTTLCENPSLRERITFFNTGLSDTPATCRIISGSTNQGDGIVQCVDDIAREAFPAIDALYVVRQNLDMVRLDSIVKQDVFVLKIDIEGHELHALNGGSGLFDKYKVHHILSEVSNFMMGKENVKLYLTMLRDKGYLISKVSFSGPWLTIVDGSELPGQENIYCVLKN